MLETTDTPTAKTVQYPLAGHDSRNECIAYNKLGWGATANCCMTCIKRGCCYPQDEE